MGILDLFRPKWKNSNASIRLEAVQKLTDESILAQLALSDISPEVRLLAVKKTTNQELLIKIALEDDDSSVREAAVKKIVDQDSLIKIALEDNDYRIREAAVQKITDESVLAQLALCDEDYKVRLLAAEKITDQDSLIKIAIENNDSSIRKVTVKKIEDQTILTKIAIEDFNEEIALLAAQKINAQSSFSKIALQAETNSARVFAAKHIEDIQVRNKLALCNIDFGLRKTIIEKISDTFVLWQIIQMSKPNSPLWEQARLNIKPLLLKKSIDYKRKLPEIIETIKRISDISELTDIAQNHRLVEARIEAVSKINDQDVLTQIAKNEIVYEVRVSAIKKLTNLYTLSEIALTEWDIPMRRQLLQIVFEQLTFLDKIEETEEINTLVLKGFKGHNLTKEESFLPYLFNSSNPKCTDTALKWLLNTFHPLSPSIIELLKIHLPDYLDILIDLRTFEQHIEYRDEGWSSDNGGPWDNEYHTYDKTLMEQATQRLCGLRTPVSSNLLHLITKRYSITVSLGVRCNSRSEGKLDWKLQKRIAFNELKSRGYPIYDPKLYLEPNAWQIK